METINKIKDLDGLLRTFLDKHVKILESSAKPFTEAGENYGSVMLDLKIKLQRGNVDKAEVLNLVAKLCPESEYLKKVFPPNVCFRNEINIYSKMVPFLKNFQVEQGVVNTMDFFPHCYTTRNSLQNDNDLYDEDAVILMENLKLSGYVQIDRMKSIDLATTRFILKDIAALHSVPIALKLIKPKEFEDNIFNNIAKRKRYTHISESSVESLIELVVRAAKLSKDESLVPKVIKAMKDNVWNVKNSSDYREPFATLIHGDYWVNNTLVKYENGLPIKNKMLDFQLIRYGSAASDLIFFLFTSVKLDLLELHYEEFIKLYHDEFIFNLKQLKCDINQFTLEAFREEIKISSSTAEFFHLMMMIKVVHAAKAKVKPLSSHTEKDLFSKSDITDLCLLRMSKIILHFSKYQWI